MTNSHGSFIWYELLTRDAKAAKAFYDTVVGWNIDAEAPPGGMDYRMINADDGQVGGVMQLDANMIAGGARPVWLGYFGVDDVDATVAAMTADGEPVLFDPAVHHGDREADLAMSELFGGFPSAFYAAYRKAWPLDGDYEQRKLLYSLYHILNHLNLFGRGYLREALRLAVRLNEELSLRRD